MKVLFLSLATITVVFLATCGPIIDKEESKTRVVLIFCDVTSSLLEAENKEVSKLAADVVDALAPGTEYFMFPIQMDGLRLTPFDHDVIVDSSVAVEQAIKQQRRERITKEISDLYRLVKNAKAPPTPYGRPDNHSCILYTLDFANSYLRQFDSQKYRREVVYISDMIEECNVTPMRKPISLAAGDISAAIQLAKDTDLKLQLSPSRLSVIIPTTSETYTAGPRPSVADLRMFWENIFLHCGFTAQDLKDNNLFYFSSGLPARFQQSQSGL